MAKEPQKAAEEVVATVAETETETQPDKDKPIITEQVVEGQGEKEKPQTQTQTPVEVEGKTISQSVSFKEETNVVGDLPEAQKKALDELKHLIQDALNKHELTAPPPPPPPPPKDEDKKAPEEVTQEDKDKEQVAEEENKKEEKKEEEKPGSASEDPKIEEKAQAEPKVEAVTETVTPTTAEEKKAEAVEVVSVTQVSVVDEDGTKTVEAIEETIVSVSATAAEEAAAAPPPETVTKTETETETEVKVEEVPAPTPPPPAPEPEPEEVEIWGIPLLADERSDVILLKFLRARDFKVKDAFTMIKNTVRWRKEFGIDALVDEDLGNDWDKVVFTHGYDKQGHPVCYNVFGEFENKELYHKTFSDEEKRHKFIRWRIQFLEKSVRKLDFTPTAISTIVQVNDLKNSPGLSKRELRQATNQALQLLQDNYPEFVAKQVFINVPWWYLAFSRMISAFLTQRTKSKFVFAGPSKSAETLFKYIAPELVPVQYGGLSREGDLEFTTDDPVTEFTIKPATKHAVEFPVSETSHLVWELRVVGWDVNYGAEFVPGAEEGYTVIVQKSRKITSADETVISNSFKTGEPGKVVLTIDNQTSKKKKLLYRSKTKPISE